VKNILIFLAMFVFVLTLPAQAEEKPVEYTYSYAKGDYFDTDIAWRVLKRSFGTIPSDLYNIASAPFRHPMQTLKYTGLVGGIIAFDRPITTFYQRHIEAPLDIYEFPQLFTPTPITKGADGWLVYGSIAHYLGGFALGDEKSQVTAIMAMKAMTYSYLLDHLLLKSLFGRRRPKNDLYHDTDPNPTHTSDPHDFSPFQPIHFHAEDGRTSLPSFHLTMYFSVAQVYAQMYDNYWLPYSALALVFASNIRGHHHWVGDMVAGGLVGTLIGRQIVSNYHDHYHKSEASDFQILPTSNGVGFNYRF
jgi:membrane-associated phospholipid phosphatase